MPTPHSVIFATFGCTSASLVSSGASGAASGAISGGGGGGDTRTQSTYQKLGIKADHVKKIYEEAVMVRKVRHYLLNTFKTIETNEERLRLISSTLEHSTAIGAAATGNTGNGGSTLRRKPSPSSSLAGSLSSMSALNNSSNLNNLSAMSSSSSAAAAASHANPMAGISSGNGTLTTQKTLPSLFGAHSPDSVNKLLALSETKVKSVKPSTSSTSMPLSHLVSNTRTLSTSSSSSHQFPLTHTSTSSGGGAHAASSQHKIAYSDYSNGAVGSLSASSSPAVLSPRSKQRSISNSQPIGKQHSSSLSSASSKGAAAAAVHLSSESSSVSTIKLNGKYMLAAVDSTPLSTSISSLSLTTSPAQQHPATNSKHNGIGNGTATKHHISMSHPTGATSSSSSFKSSTLLSQPPSHLSIVKHSVTGASSTGTEADSGRASMASNVDQDQCSPILVSRDFTLNKCKSIQLASIIVFHQ